MKTSGELKNSFYKWLDENPDGKVWDWMHKILKEESNQVQVGVMWHWELDQKVKRDNKIGRVVIRYSEQQGERFYPELYVVEWNDGTLEKGFLWHGLMST
jgi:hypothetical protein